MNKKHNGPVSFTLLEDNFGPHHARSVTTYLQNKEVTRMVWPSQSPELNCIENVSGFMKTHLHKRSIHPRNPIELFQVLSDLWNSLPD